jgi:hypothetical protein
MKEQLTSYETAVLAKEKGWDGDFIESHKILTTQSLLQKWIREIYDIHINIRHEDYFHLSKYKYFHYDISQGSLTDVTKNQDLHGDIMDECSQDIPGNYLNDEKFSKLIFEREFAFKTYEEALEHGLQQALKLIKNK